MDTDPQKPRNLPNETLLRTFYWLLQTVKIHQDNNKVVRESASAFVSAIVESCADEPHITLEVFGGRFFLTGKKLICWKESLDLVHGMLHFLESRGLQGFRLYSNISGAPIEQVLAFARVLNQAERQQNPLVWVAQQLEGSALPWAEIVHSSVILDEETKLRERTRRTYSYALASVKEIGQKIFSRSPVGIRKLKRVVQNLVELVSKDESLLLGMSTIRDFDDYTYTHSVNVAILALCLGKRVGLLQTGLELVGICGLLHDLGKTEIPREILLKPGKLSDQEFEEIKRHPLKSVTQIVKLPIDGDLKAMIIPPIFEHHLRYDLSGYPSPHPGKPQGLFGRILAIADVFDALTSARVYRTEPFSPDQALSLIMEGAGKNFDPILLKVFVNMLGVFPVGTLLELDTGEIGLVMETPEEAMKERPMVLILAPDGKGGFRKGNAVSLEERDPATGLFSKNIVRTRHPGKYGIQPAEFLV